MPGSDVSSVPNRYRGHNPKSPEDDMVGGNLYIKLSDQHRLRKVRDTVYEDPGNPFELDTIEDTTLPSINYQQDADANADNRGARQQWDMNSIEVPQRTKQEISSMFSDPFDLATVNDGTTSSQDSRESSSSLRDADTFESLHRETFQSSTSSDQRSMSVDIAFLPDAHRTQERELHQSDSSRLVHFPHPSGTLFTEDTRRDSKFYDFYDSILAEYGIEPSRNTVPLKQQPLPVTR